MRRTAYLGLPLLLLFGLAMQAIAQTPAAAPKWNSKAEYDAYNTAYTEKAPAKKAELSDKFLTDFKTADVSFRTDAYIMEIKAYVDAQAYDKAMDAASKATDVIPNIAADKKVAIYSYGMDAARMSNNVPKTLEFGDKVLSVAPDDLNTLITLSSTIPAAPGADKAALDKADQYASKALGLVAKLDPKALGLSDADWAKQRIAIEGTLHTTLGGNAYTRTDYPKAIEELTIATKDDSKNDLAWYQMGLVLIQQGAAVTKDYMASVKVQNDVIAATPTDTEKINGLKDASSKLEATLRAKRDAAIDALATATALGGPFQDPARKQLEKQYSAKTGSLDGLDQLIASKKQP